MTRLEQTLDEVLIADGDHEQGQTLVDLAKWAEKQDPDQVAKTVQRQLGRVLKFFVNHQISPIIRRWAGYFVFKALILDAVTVDKKISSSAKRLGSTIADAPEDLKVVAFMIMQTLYSKGLSIPQMWSQELQAKMFLDPESFVDIEKPEWLRSCQDQLDDLHSQGVIQSSSQTDFLYDVQIEGKEHITEGACSILVIFQKETITLVAPPTSTTPFVFVDIPLDSIGIIQRRKTPIQLSNQSTFVKDELKIPLHAGCAYNAKVTDIESMSWIFHTAQEADRITTLVQHAIAQTELHKRSSATQPLQVGNAPGISNGKPSPQVSTPQKGQDTKEDVGSTGKSSRKSRKKHKQSRTKLADDGPTSNSANPPSSPQDAQPEVPDSLDRQNTPLPQKQRHQLQSEDNSQVNIAASEEKGAIDSKTQLERGNRLPRLHVGQKRKFIGKDSEAQDDIRIFDYPESPEVERKKSKKSHDATRSKHSSKKKKKAGSSGQFDARDLKDDRKRSTDAKPTSKLDAPVTIKREPETTPDPGLQSPSREPAPEEPRKIGSSQAIPIEISSSDENSSDAPSDPDDETYKPGPKKPFRLDQQARAVSTPIAKSRSQQPKEQKSLSSALKKPKTPAIDESAQRKPTVIGFSEKGPRNQGSSTTKQTPQPPTSLMPIQAPSPQRTEVALSHNKQWASPFVDCTPGKHSTRHNEKKRGLEELSELDSPRNKRYKTTEPSIGGISPTMLSHKRRSWRDQQRPRSQQRRESVCVTGNGSPMVLKTGSATNGNGTNLLFSDNLNGVIDSPTGSGVDDGDNELYDGQTQRSFEPRRLSSNRKALPVSPHMESQAISGFATEADIERLSSDHVEDSPFAGTNTHSAPPSAFVRLMKAKLEKHAARVHPTPKTEVRHQQSRQWKQQQDDSQEMRHIKSTAPAHENKVAIGTDSSDVDSVLGYDEEEEQAIHEHDQEWQASLAPHHKHMLDILFRCSRSIVRQLSDTETAIDDMIDEYIEDGQKLIQELEGMHRDSYQDQLNRFRQVGESLTTSLGNVKEKAASRQRDVSSTLDESRRKRREKAHLQQVQTMKELIP